MKRPFSWWSENFLWAEFWLAVTVTAAFIIWTFYCGGQEIIAEVIRGNRSAVYGALASVFGSLLGFAITAESIVLGLSGSERLQIIRQSKHYTTLWRVFTSAIRALGLATAVALIGLVIDRDNHPIWLCLVLTVFATVLAFLRLLRCIWVLENIVALVSASSQERKGGE
jgi:hypothetical protein